MNDYDERMRKPNGRLELLSSLPKDLEPYLESGLSRHLALQPSSLLRQVADMMYSNTYLEWLSIVGPCPHLMMDPLVQAAAQNSRWLPFHARGGRITGVASLSTVAVVLNRIKDATSLSSG